MRLKQCLVLGLVLASGLASAQYKCTEKGKVVYQDHACASEAGSQKLQLNAPAEASSAAEANASVSRIKEQADSMEALRLAMEQGRPLVGMTAAQLSTVMGSPTHVNAANYQGKVSDQRVYVKNGRTYYVYTDGSGSVTAIQDQPAIGGKSAPRPKGGLVSY